MLLTYHDKMKILEEFPIKELSYEKKIYKKVHHSDFYIIIPKGEKCFAWFRQFKGQPVCIIMHMENRSKIKDIKIYISCFKDGLCSDNGTIVYGTFFTYKGYLFFSIEDIFYFINKYIALFSQYKKIALIHCLLKEYVKQISIPNIIIFGLPVMETDYNIAIEMTHRVLYDAQYLQHRMMYKTRPYLNQIIQPKKYGIFSIRCSIQTDIYYLYCSHEDNTMKRHSICHIPDFNTSKMMNNLFRDIKENNNLDALEESDDEEEFENIQPGKYAHLDRVYNMLCVYNKKFKRWKPTKIDEKSKITKYKIICQIEKK